MNNNYNLNNKIAIVTGAARGIGKAISQNLADAGAIVIATDILIEELEQTAIELGRNVSATKHDVTNENEWQQLVDTTLNGHGKIDILVNNAGILKFSTLDNTSPEDFRRLMEVNVTGSFLGLRAVTKTMKNTKQGVIINMSSSSAILPNNGTGAYAASKFAIRGLSRSAALELGPHGIRVNSVHPGGVNTPMTNPQGLDKDQLNARYKFVPQQRGCEPEEIAAAVRFLVSDQGSYCNGMEMVVDGGLTAGQYFYGVPGAPNLRG